MKTNFINKHATICSDRMIFNFIAYLFCITFMLICVTPFIMVISSSLSSEQAVLRNGYSVIPKEFSIQAYIFLFRSADIILRAYGVSIFVTITGTFLSLLTLSMTAYAISRKNLRTRNYVSFYFYFTMLFWGGLLPYYILVVKYLHLRNNLIVLLIPGMTNIFNLMIIRSFVVGNLPDSIAESVRTDGGGEFTIFFRIVLPLIKPVLAAIGLFTALAYWNDWFNTMLFIENRKLFNLQYTLYNILSKANYLASGRKITHLSTQVLPNETIKLAMTVIAIGPIMLAYPLVQKYFVKGVTLGAVKG